MTEMTETNLPGWPLETEPIETGEVDGVLWAISPAHLYGAINGYVHLPENHPFRDINDYNDIPVEVHGGITYDSTTFWIGFDMLHSGDYWPGQPFRSNYDVLRTAEDVKREAMNLARQVAAHMHADTYSI